MTGGHGVDVSMGLGDPREGSAAHGFHDRQPKILLMRVDGGKVGSPKPFVVFFPGFGETPMKASATHALPHGSPSFRLSTIRFPKHDEIRRKVSIHHLVNESHPSICPLVPRPAVIP